MSELKNDTKYIVENFFSEIEKDGFEHYDAQHGLRYPQTVNHLLSYDIKNNIVCDMGCGSGYFLKNLDSSNRVIGFDGATIDIEDEIERYQYNFDYDQFASQSGVTEVDHMLCFETFEHLSNPYNFIFECKKMMKEGGLYHISYPDEDIQHNTFYPSLLWETKNFIQFMEQMAFLNKTEFKMKTRFGHVHFFVFENRPWDEVKMKWPKSHESFHAQPPHVQVNL